MTTVSSDRSQLGFPDAVKACFSFLTKEGFQIVEENPTLVRYQSQGVVASVFHGRASYELGVEFATVGAPNEKFNLYRMLVWARQAGMLTELPSMAYQTNSKDEIKRMVCEIAALVQKYGGPILIGDAVVDAVVYTALREEQSRDAVAYTNEVHLRAARRQAEEAWQAKDYAAVARIYEQINGDDLSASEVMRLHYAEKAVGRRVDVLS